MKMPKKAMESLTESMFYVLMALMRRPMCGIEAVRFGLTALLIAS